MSKTPMCEFCVTEPADFEGWFYTEARNNPFAVGTASAGLMQLRVACRSCTQKAIDANLTKFKKLPKLYGK